MGLPAERRKEVLPMAKDPINKLRRASGPTPNLEEQIRRRAYELYEQRGREHGHDLEDWLRARAEISGQTVRTMGATQIK